MIKKIALILSIIVSFTFVWLINISCEKNNFTTDPEDKLIFSKDTVQFDTVFTQKGSATRYFVIKWKCTKCKTNSFWSKCYIAK
jgi:predicted RecB family nuclease